jgi:alkanesulfonate monooxygenase SsuD/methylene tetrahydromethanopterin reductase-like flavin-dependent oxidoreductase (luciferase family)
MRYGLLCANIGSYSDPTFVADLAEAAENAGWDGLFIWDHLAFVWGMPTADPWVTLTVCALRTSRIVLGPGITPVPRRRVQDLALEVATLDRLSGGRVVFGAGLGGNRAEFEHFGESFSVKRRMALLDEGLATLRAWWDGEEVDGVALKPPPAGRVPIWVGGNSDEALAWAARYDGWFANTAGKDDMTMSPDEVAAKAAAAGEGEVVVHGYSRVASPADYAAAGATWWLENLNDLYGPPEEMRALVRSGPPA